MVTLVIFDSEEIAQQVDEAINRLRVELGRPASYEFHFTGICDEHRTAFLNAVAGFPFNYLGFVVNKPLLYSETLTKDKKKLYNYVCGMIFENAKPFLNEAKVRIDKSGNRPFQKELARYLKMKINERGESSLHIKDIKPANSHGNNLVQMADMICGAVARAHYPKKKDAAKYRQIIKHREHSVRFWPM